MTTSARPAVDGPPRLLRRSRGRVVAGVAGGVAEHLRLPVLVVRVAFVVLTVVGGIGILLYAAFWASVPQDRSGAAGDRSNRSQLLLYGAVAVGLLAGLDQLGVIGSGLAVLPLLVCAIGAAIIWGQADALQRGTSTGGEPVRLPWLPRSVPGLPIGGRGLLTLGGGLVLVVGGLIGFLAVNHELAATRDGLVVTAAVVGGLALVTAPWWWRLANELTEERRARIRTQERADLAAHVHDSVLHTLALIQRNAGDQREVVRLARGQERELRSWLYQGTASPEEKLSAALAQAAAEVEDSFAVTVDPVVVGDTDLTERLRALVAATREAMVNAGKHAATTTISLYAEVEQDDVTVFVRDRGTGFDAADIPEDRHGISGSIVDRMARHGGTATVKSVIGEGTEVRLTMGRSPHD